MAAGRPQSAWATKVTIILAIVLYETGVHARVGYTCFFGPMTTTQGPDGSTLHFCATGLNPPFMTRGHYVEARDSGDPGRCFECVCEDQIGMACCEKRCPLTV